MAATSAKVSKQPIKKHAIIMLLRICATGDCDRQKHVIPSQKVLPKNIDILFVRRVTGSIVITTIPRQKAENAANIKNIV
jgi:hypothetical protein